MEPSPIHTAQGKRPGCSNEESSVQTATEERSVWLNFRSLCLHNRCQKLLGEGDVFWLSVDAVANTFCGVVTVFWMLLLHQEDSLGLQKRSWTVYSVSSISAILFAISGATAEPNSWASCKTRFLCLSTYNYIWFLNLAFIPDEISNLI